MNNINKKSYMKTMMMNDIENEKYWNTYFEKNYEMKYQIIAAPAMEELGANIERLYPKRFKLHKSSWKKFPDGTDQIEVGGFQPVNRISGEDVIMLCSFHNNDVTLSQFSVMVTLLQSFVKSLTIVLPFYPVGTMERVTKEGEVATANTYAQMFSNLPSCGRPSRKYYYNIHFINLMLLLYYYILIGLIVYDLHTLQNRFYLHGNAVASLQTTIPLLIDEIKRTDINCIAFPDDGAAKRFGSMFKGLGLEIVTCGKTRNGDKRVVTIQDGDCKGKNVVIVDDLVQTGGTLYECGVALRNAGATSVSAFCAHGVFPNESWRRFLKSGDRNCFEKFYLTNSIPTVTDILPKDDVYVILDLTKKIVEDLDKYS
jgi:phosphoribosylpyrophosphate synthetase